MSRGEELPRQATRVIPEISATNQFLDVVDIDKRVFGMGPIQGIELHTRRSEASKENSIANVAESFQPLKHENRGMHARLEALADQLDQLEQSAQALQHDLAFSVKVCHQQAFPV
jgi:hypothetical protein